MVTFLKVVQAHVWMGSWHRKQLAYPMISGPVKLNFTVNPGLHVANHTLDSRAYLILWLWQLFQRTRGDHNVYTVSFWCLDACVKGEDNCVSKTINISTQDVNTRSKQNADNRNGKKTSHTYSLITFFLDIRFKFLTWYRHISLSTSLDVMHKWASYKNTNCTT